MYTPPEAFIFRWKNKTGVTSTLGPHRPHQHYKTKVPRVQNVKLEHSQARIELQEEKQKTKLSIQCEALGCLWPHRAH